MKTQVLERLTQETGNGNEVPGILDQLGISLKDNGRFYLADPETGKQKIVGRDNVADLVNSYFLSNPIETRLAHNQAMEKYQLAEHFRDEKGWEGKAAKFFRSAYKLADEGSQLRSDAALSVAGIYLSHGKLDKFLEWTFNAASNRSDYQIKLSLEKKD